MTGSGLGYSCIRDRSPNGVVKMVRVFLVDDSAPIRERLIRLLSKVKEVEVIGGAVEAQSAIQSIHSLKPDVVLLDIRLSGEGTGFDVLRHIKPIEPAPLVIVLTSHPYPQYRDKCLDEGAAYFFDKSTQFGLIVPILERLSWQGRHPHPPESDKKDSA